MLASLSRPPRLAPLDYDSDDPQIPQEFKCPITRELMLHPVCMADGTTCEASAARDYFKANPHSPVRGLSTNRPLSHRNTAPNIALIALVEHHFPRAAALRQARIAAARETAPTTAAPIPPTERPWPQDPRLPQPVWVAGALLGFHMGLLGGDLMVRIHRDFLGWQAPEAFTPCIAGIGAAWFGTLGAICVDRMNAHHPFIARRAADLMLQPLINYGLAIACATLVGLWNTPDETRWGAACCMLRDLRLTCVSPNAQKLAIGTYVIAMPAVMVRALGHLQGLLAPD